MRPSILATLIACAFSLTGCAQFWEYMKPMLTATTHVDSGPFMMDAYNEEAFVEYRDHLRRGLEMMSLFQATRAEVNQTTGQHIFPSMVLNNLRVEMNILISDIHRWPPDAKAQAWRVMGNEIQSLQEQFVSERKRVLADKYISADLKQALRDISLLEISHL